MTNFIWKRPERALSTLRDEPFTNLQKAMNGLFDDFFNTDLFTTSPTWRKAVQEAQIFQPKVNVRDSADKVEVTAELPGVDEKDIHLTVDKEYFRIKGEKRFEKEGNEDDRHYIERHYGSFERVIPLSAEVDREKTEASFKNGVLKVTLPKLAAHKNEPRRITIKGS